MENLETIKDVIRELRLINADLDTVMSEEVLDSIWQDLDKICEALDKIDRET